MKTLSLRVLPDQFAICRLPPDAPVPEPVAGGGFWSLTRTGKEVSVVLPSAGVPAGCKCETGWRCLEVQGPLAFDLTGVLAALAAPLAEAGISIFCISTYDTDYVLVRLGDLPAAERALRESGHTILGM